MKRWLKRYGKWLVITLGVLFIANGLYGAITTTEEWKLIIHIAAIAFWVVLIVCISGITERIFRWWERD